MATTQKKTRVSRPSNAGITATTFASTFRSYATNATAEAKLIAKMDAEITAVRNKYSEKLDELKKQNETHFTIMQTYCLENKSQLFSERRTLETVYGNAGFRLGTPKLKTLPKFTWEKVLLKLEPVLPAFVRVKKEIDKEQLLAERNNPDIATQFAAIGVYVAQDESFFIDLKKEETGDK